MPTATWSRLLQFRAGPNETTFHACEEHKADLEKGDGPSGLFFARAADPVVPVDPDDEIACYFCYDGPLE